MEAKRTELSNGMTLLLKEDDSYPVVAVQLWVKVGSVHENYSNAGISHFVEHFLFKGTSTLSSDQISKMIIGAGGEINAYTTFEQTAYHVVIAARYWEMALEVLADMVQNSSFPEEGLESERKVILEEIKEGEDNPDVLLSQKLFQEVYRVQPYRRPVIGYAKTVSSIKREDLVRHFEEYYAPSNMILTVTGSFDSTSVVRKVTDLFSKNPFRPPKGIFMPPESPQQSLRFGVVKKGETEKIVEMAFRIPPVYHSDIPALDILAIVLGEGDNAWLNRELVFKKELARDAGAMTFTPSGNGMFLARISPFPNSVEKSIAEAVRVIANFIKKGPERHEIERARAIVEKELIFQEETVYGLGRKLAYYESVFGDYLYERSYLDLLRKIDKEDLQRVAATYLKAENMTVALLYPEKEGKVLRPDKFKKIIRSTGFQVAKTKSRVQKVHTGKREETVREYSLGNGLRIISKKNRLSPLVSMMAIVPGGVRSETVRDNGISNLVSSLIQKGTKKHDWREISDEVTRCGGYVESFVGKNSFGLRMDALSENFDRSMSLFFDLLLNSVFPSHHLKSEKKKTIEDVKSIRDNFDAYSYLEFLKAIFPGHPYSLNSLGELGSLKRMERRDILKRYRRILDPKNMIFAIAGSYNEKSMLAKVRKNLGPLKTRIENSFVNYPFEPLSKPVEVRKKIKSNNAYIHLGFRGVGLGSDDKYPLEIVGACLSNFGEGRLYSHLREKLGLAYSVFASVFHGIEIGYVDIYMNTDPKNVQTALLEIRSVLVKLKEEGIGEEELARVKNFLAGSYEIELQKNSSQAMNLALNKLYSLPLSLESYPEEIMGITKERVDRAARKYLDLDRYVQVVLTP